MVRTSAPVASGNSRLNSSLGNINGEVIKTNLGDARVSSESPDLPELGTTLSTHDLNGELVKVNLSEIEGANDNVQAMLSAQKTL